MSYLTQIKLIFKTYLLSSIALAGPCEPPSNPYVATSTKEGYVQFLPTEKLNQIRSRLPNVVNPEIDTLLKSNDTIWYDEGSIVFGYQDSIEVVVGFRANCVGRTVGENNASNPGIAILMNLFGPDYRFYFPFRMAAGTDNSSHVVTVNFWSPPSQDGKRLPVRYWKQSSRGRWGWTFPVGTVFGEVLFQTDTDNNLYPFEVRIRKRYLDGWAVNAFRPFAKATDLFNEIEKRKPNWQTSSNLKKVMDHLQDKNTLIPHRLESKPYASVFSKVDGALDRLPSMDDTTLVKALLNETPFVSVEGAIWKENDKYETYAPSSDGEFGIVAKNYEMGMIPVNEVSCNRCHQTTGKKLGDFEFNAILYGEVWGEDRIFTWHPFKPSQFIYNTWDDTQGSRQLNPALVSSKLILSGKPAAGDLIYKPLPSPFVPENKTKNKSKAHASW